ncbi:DNA repair RecN domain protein [Rickettsia amblyommatis str. Darkwater]|nr:DNA repair RecN domain protein [Rickettsia amblyommatis str. Darkwater]
MFCSLSVKNFILIDELEIEFNKGLCVITGETEPVNLFYLMLFYFA